MFLRKKQVLVRSRSCKNCSFWFLGTTLRDSSSFLTSTLLLFDTVESQQTSELAILDRIVCFNNHNFTSVINQMCTTTSPRNKKQKVENGEQLNVNAGNVFAC